MRRSIIIGIAAMFSLTLALPAFAQSMMWGIRGSDGASSEDAGRTAQEERDGRDALLKLRDGRVACEGLDDETFGALGEYYMGLMIADAESHAAMDRMMERMMGEQGEELMHVTMGKRVSGCDETAVFSPQGYGFVPMMMGVMGGGMMGGWGFGPAFGAGFGAAGGSANWRGVGAIVTTLLTWTVLVLAIVLLFRLIIGKRK